MADYLTAVETTIEAIDNSIYDPYDGYSWVTYKGIGGISLTNLEEAWWGILEIEMQHRSSPTGYEYRVQAYIENTLIATVSCGSSVLLRIEIAYGNHPDHISTITFKVDGTIIGSGTYVFDNYFGIERLRDYLIISLGTFGYVWGTWGHYIYGNVWGRCPGVTIEQLPYTIDYYNAPETRVFGSDPYIQSWDWTSSPPDTIRWIPYYNTLGWVPGGVDAEHADGNIAAFCYWTTSAIIDAACGGVNLPVANAPTVEFTPTPDNNGLDSPLPTTIVLFYPPDIPITEIVAPALDPSGYKWSRYLYQDTHWGGGAYSADKTFTNPLPAGRERHIQLQYTPSAKPVCAVTNMGGATLIHYDADA